MTPVELFFKALGGRQTQSTWATKFQTINHIEAVLNEGQRLVFSLSNKPDHIRMDRVEVPEALRGSGLAKKAVQKVIAAADQAGVSVSSDTSPDDDSEEYGEEWVARRDRLNRMMRSLGFTTDYAERIACTGETKEEMQEKEKRGWMPTQKIYLPKWRSNPPQEENNMLDKASHDLERLKDFLRRDYELSSGIKLQWDAEHDLVNRNDPRAFCYMRPNDPVIYCSAAVESLLPEARIGVLLHELGHLILAAFCGDDCEVDVDDFCMNDVRASGYHYEDVQYLSPWTNELVTAKNLECVSPAFLEEVYGADEDGDGDDKFQCASCSQFFDVEDSIRDGRKGGELICQPCFESKYGSGLL